jgi:hypothetical protein
VTDGACLGNINPVEWIFNPLFGGLVCAAGAFTPGAENRRQRLQTGADERGRWYDLIS